MKPDNWTASLPDCWPSFSALLLFHARFRKWY